MFAALRPGPIKKNRRIVPYATLAVKGMRQPVGGLGAHDVIVVGVVNDRPHAPRMCKPIAMAHLLPDENSANPGYAKALAVVAADDAAGAAE